MTRTHFARLLAPGSSDIILKSAPNTPRRILIYQAAPRRVLLRIKSNFPFTRSREPAEGFADCDFLCGVSFEVYPSSHVLTATEDNLAED
jgi:hypothetical protein